MADAVGHLTPAAFRRATTWGVAVACGAGSGVRYRSIGIKPDVALIEDEQNTGVVGQLKGDPGNRLVAGDFVLDALYEGLEDILAHTFGLVTITQMGTDNAWKKVFKLNPTLKGIFGTHAWRPLEGEEVHELPSAKIVGFTWKCSAGKRAELTLKIAAFDFIRDSTVNTTATFSTVTFPANDVPVLFRHMKVRVHDTAAPEPLGDAHLLDVNDVAIEYDGSFKVDDITTKYGDRIEEPTREMDPTVKVTLTFSKYQTQNRSLFQAALRRTPKKMDVVCTGPIAAGTTPYQWSFFLPSVQFGGAPEVSGKGYVGFSVEGMAKRVTSVPAGFPAGYLDLVTLETVSQRSTNPLS